MSETRNSPNSGQSPRQPHPGQPLPAQPWVATGNLSSAEETPRPLTVLHQTFTSGSKTRWHSHRRAELLHASGGLLVLNTENGAWTAPAGHALIVASNTPHELAAYGCCEMRAAFLTDEAVGHLAPGECKVIAVSDLLDVCLRSLADGPLLYDVDGRGGHLATLAIEEVVGAAEMEIALPLPRSSRLRNLSRELIQNPALGFDLDDWSEKVGVSRSTFTRRFRSETGLSFAEWRRRLRLLHALTLQAGGAPLQEAARMTGYRSTNALRDMMRRAKSEPQPGAAEHMHVRVRRQKHWAASPVRA